MPQRARAPELVARDAAAVELRARAPRLHVAHERALARGAVAARANQIKSGHMEFMSHTRPGISAGTEHGQRHRDTVKRARALDTRVCATARGGGSAHTRTSLPARSKPTPKGREMSIARPHTAADSPVA